MIKMTTNFDSFAKKFGDASRDIVEAGFKQGMTSAMRDVAAISRPSSAHEFKNRSGFLAKSAQGKYDSSKKQGSVEIDLGISNVKDYAKAIYFGQKSTGKIKYKNPWRGDDWIDRAMQTSMPKIIDTINKSIASQIKKHFK